MDEIIDAANSIRRSRMELLTAQRILSRHNLLVTDGHHEKMETLLNAEMNNVVNYTNEVLCSTRLFTEAERFNALRKIRKFL